MSQTVAGGPDEPSPDVRTYGVLTRTAQWMIPGCALLLLAFLDGLDPATEPRIGLGGRLALTAWVFAESGRIVWITAMATALTVVLVTRPGLSRRGRIVETAVIGFVSLLVLLGGNLLNDHVVKPALGVARPDIVQLSELDLLGIDVDRFYAMSESSRSAYLDGIKTENGFGDLEMRHEVRDHWVRAVGYSRPSGHALAAMTFATFYLSMALSSLSGWRRRPFFLLVPWAVCVCLSRPILGVHWPVDVVIGGLVGMVVGGAGFVVVHRLLGAGAADAEESGAGVQPPST